MISWPRYKFSKNGLKITQEILQKKDNKFQIYPAIFFFKYQFISIFPVCL